MTSPLLMSRPRILDPKEKKRKLKKDNMKKKKE